MIINFKGLTAKEQGIAIKRGYDVSVELLSNEDLEHNEAHYLATGGYRRIFRCSPNYKNRRIVNNIELERTSSKPEVTCPDCESGYLYVNTITTAITSDEQYLYTCGSCSYMFGDVPDFETFT